MRQINKASLVYSAALLAIATFASVYLWGAFQSREKLAKSYLEQLKRSDRHAEHPFDNTVLVRSILATGADGISEIAREISAVGADGARYSPTPGELMFMFGEAGRAGLQAEFYRNKVNMLLSDDGGLSRQAPVTFIVAALMRHFSDDSLLVEWAEQISRCTSYLQHRDGVPSTREVASIKSCATSMMYFQDSVPKEWIGDGFPILGGVVTESDVLALRMWVKRRREVRDME